MLFDWVFGSRRRKSKVASHKPAVPPRARPYLEELDSRIVPAAPAGFVVNILGDTPDAIVGDGLARDAQGNTSLRAAIMEANATGTDTISFQVTGAITLDTALPAITKSFSILGPGSNALTVERSAAAGTPQFRIFRVGASITVNLSGLTITKGEVATDGGGIYNSGTLNLYDIVAIDNIAVLGHGGGILNFGTLTVENSWIIYNTAGLDGGGVANYGYATIQWDSRILLNNAGSDGGGIKNFDTGTLTIIDSWVDENGAKYGGGIANAGSLTMQGGQTLWNMATEDGGGIYNSLNGTATLTGVSIQHNNAKKGGGFYVLSGSLTLNNCTLSNNTATVLGAGGAFKPLHPPTLIGGTITDPVVPDP